MTQPPSEPEATKTPSQIVLAKVVDGVDPSPEERQILKQYVWDNPGLRLARQIRTVFPDIQEEILAEIATYDTATDPAYTVQGEASQDATRQAEGLNRGEWWVARFVGEWIVDDANGALQAATGREVADRHFRMARGATS